MRRPRNLKGTPFKKGEKNTKVGSTSAAGSDAVDQEHDEADLTDEVSLAQFSFPIPITCVCVNDQLTRNVYSIL